MIRSAFFTGVLVAAGCVAHLPGVVATAPTPTSSNPSSPSASPTPNSCASTATAAPGVQLVGITLQVGISSPTPQPYGVVGGYALVNQTTNTIDITAAVPIALLPTDAVQFVNADAVRSLSAVGLASSAIASSGAFPASYAFPGGAASASGTQIDGSGTWSTGSLAPGCYSQVFTFPQSGTYYFGDPNLYATPSVFLRDVFVISASAPQ